MMHCLPYTALLLHFIGPFCHSCLKVHLADFTNQCWCHRVQQNQKNPLFAFLSIQKPKWPNLTLPWNRSRSKSRVIIWTNLIGSEPTVLHTKFQGHWPFGSWEGEFWFSAHLLHSDKVSFCDHILSIGTSVHASINNFFKQHLLLNHWLDFDQTSLEWSLVGPLSKLFK